MMDAKNDTNSRTRFTKIILAASIAISCLASDNHVANGTQDASNILDQPGIQDSTEDSLFDPLQADPDSCELNNLNDPLNDPSCWQLPRTSVEEEAIYKAPGANTVTDDDDPLLTLPENVELSGIRCSYGGDDPDADVQDLLTEQCKDHSATETVTIVDKHWGSDPNILRMRDRLRSNGSGESIKRHVLRKNEATKSTSKSDKNKGDLLDSKDDVSDSTDTTENRRPPIFLMPGLASTRLVAWRTKSCLLADIKMKDYVWLNLNLIMRMSTIDVECLSECLKLGWNQSDTDDLTIGCKLRPDEGLDAISSLSPGGIGPQLLVGGTNTVYAWLIQWLADNLGYDVSSLIGLPYDWRLSPDKMESRDGFLTLTRHRIEAAVQSNGGEPGIFVAHSMGNLIFRYFLNWLRAKLRKETFQRYVKQFERRRAMQAQSTVASTLSSGWTGSSIPGFEEWWQKNKDRVDDSNSASENEQDDIAKKRQQLRELAVIEGDAAWYDWIERHIWTYVGLSAPLLGAVNPVRSVISGESMGLPVADDAARWIELTFGSTHTVNPVSTQQGFCDEWDVKDKWDEEPDKKKQQVHADSRLACMDDILTEIEMAAGDLEKAQMQNPWKNFPALEHLLRKRANWDVDFPMIRVLTEVCDEKDKSPCNVTTTDFGPSDVQNGNIFTRMSQIWKEKEDPLVIKRDQLRESFWDTDVKNILNETWDRPLIKHVVMAYGVDLPTEVGYEYRKLEKIKKKSKTDDKNAKKKKEESYDGIPSLSAVIWETEGGQLVEERIENQNLLGDLWKVKKTKKTPLKHGTFHHSGDGSVPYISLSWAHTWLLHAGRALRYSKKLNKDFSYCSSNENCTEAISNPLDDIKISHRPTGAMEWLDGPPPKTYTTLGEKKIEQNTDTGTENPHGTKYKPEMVRYHNRGTSRTTGIEYTTTVIEAIGVEHKETTR